MPVEFFWGGVNSLAFFAPGATLWIDPFFTRPPARALFRQVPCNRALVAQHVERADAVLVTHSHYDHLMDVPEVLRRTGARAYGSPLTAALLRRHGLPPEQSVTVEPGQQIDLGFCQVDVLPAWHTHTPLDRVINRPQSAAAIERLRLPLRPVDYHMDACFSYRIHIQGQRFLVGNEPAAAEVVFVSPYLPEARLRALIEAARPRRIVLIHWDDFTRPLAQPLQPMIITRSHGLAGWQPAGRLDPRAMIRRVRAIDPRVEVIVPELFQRMV